MALPAKVTIVEVGPRDGLQNESRSVPTAQKIQLIQRLATAGLGRIECGSFVSAKSIPAMADSADVFIHLPRKLGVRYSALIPNVRGLQAALACGVNEIAIFASASETFSLHNIRCSIHDSLIRYGDVSALAEKTSIKVRGYISCVAGCPYEGPIRPAAVLRVAEEFLDMGCSEISLGDTIGIGTPGQIKALLIEVLKTVPVSKVAVHFHDTWGQALANILMALELGISVVDSSVAGLGGCPYAPGAAGNVATEDVLYMLHGMGIETGVDLELVAEAGREICAVLKRSPASKASLALAAQVREKR